jgi:hypothetical protein
MWAGKLAGALLVAVVLTQVRAETLGDAVPALQTIKLPDGRTAVVQRLAVPAPAAEPVAVSYPPAPYVVLYDRWSEADEKAFGKFIFELGDSGCATINRCLHDPRNPFRGSDPSGWVFNSDCADLPYVLRFYFAWKRHLPFSFQSEVEPRGASGDMRYSPSGNRVVARVYPAGQNAYAILDNLRDAISSASYRIHPELEEPLQQDFYSPAITPKSIHAGTVIYDPNGHLAVVWKVERNGRIRYLDAHPDYSVTRGFYDLRFIRSSPGMGAGFKNWRPQRLEDALKNADGSLRGGEIVLAANKKIPG